MAFPNAAKSKKQSKILIMKKIITMVFAVASVAVAAQKNQPFYLVEGILSSSAAVKNMDTNEIQSMSIYKTANHLPEDIQQYAPFKTEGIIDIKLKHHSNDEVVTPTGLNIENHLPEHHEVIINGIKTSPDKIKIFKKAIAIQSVIVENGVSFLNIETTYEGYNRDPKDTLITGNK